MTKREKIERFDAVDAERDRYMLALHDLVNNKFEFPVIEYKSDKIGRYKIRMSWRAMPLFLVVYERAGQSDQAYVLTEEQILRAADDGGSADPYIAMLVRARQRCIARHDDKDRIARQIAESKSNAADLA